jgi:adenylosuccinate synthase
VLNDFKELKIGTAYIDNGKKISQVPYNLISDNLRVFYEDVNGWNSSLKEISSRASMPGALKDYIKFIEDRTKVPVIGLSYGPDRTETLFF